MSKYKIIAICGKAGAGKDTLLRAIADRYNVNKIISCTTRPKREGEKDGIDYFYISQELFASKIMMDEMLEATEFNGWFYGTSKRYLNPVGWNVGVFNPEGIEALIENPEVELQVFYLAVPDKIRMIRQLNREDNPNVGEICRRFQTDEKDFRFLESRFDFTALNNYDKIELEGCIEYIAQACTLLDKTG